MNRILIVDDHELIHLGIANFFHNYDNFEIIGHAYNGNQAIEMTAELHPDIIFMDISMPDMNGMEVTAIILKNDPAVKIIALTQHNEVAYANQILSSGAKGYLLKNSSKEEFYLAMNAVINGKIYISQDISEKIISHSLARSSSEAINDQIHLTVREIEIIKKIAEGKNNKSIADELFISIRTVETHRRNIMQKLKVTTVVGLLKIASKLNLITMK